MTSRCLVQIEMLFFLFVTAVFRGRYVVPFFSMIVTVLAVSCGVFFV